MKERLEITLDLSHRGQLLPEERPSLFEALGGRDAIAQLVDGLYDRFEADPIMRPAFGRDLTNERHHVKLFFEEWFGNGSAYYDELWRPGMRHRHERIAITRAMAGRWVGHFLDSLAEVNDDPQVRKALQPVISRLAMSLVNRTSDEGPLRLRCEGKSMAAMMRQIALDDPVGVHQASQEHPRAVSSEALLAAALRGKVRAAEALIDAGVDVNATSLLNAVDARAAGLPMIQITALCVALARKRTATVQMLVDRGARYDIFCAAALGDLVAIGKVLDEKPDLANAIDPACDMARITPLVHAVASGQSEAALLLLQRGASVHPNSARLLMAAGEKGDEELIDALLEHGADAKSLGVGRWVLFPGIAAKLLNRGADVNRPEGKWIGICCTGNSGHRENLPLAKALLDCGADRHAKYRGQTALECATKAGFANIVDLLKSAP